MVLVRVGGDAAATGAAPDGGGRPGPGRPGWWWCCRWSRTSRCTARCGPTGGGWTPRPPPHCLGAAARPGRGRGRRLPGGRSGGSPAGPASTRCWPRPRHSPSTRAAWSFVVAPAQGIEPIPAALARADVAIARPHAAGTGSWPGPRRHGARVEAAPRCPGHRPAVVWSAVPDLPSTRLRTAAARAGFPPPDCDGAEEPGPAPAGGRDPPHGRRPGGPAVRGRRHRRARGPSHSLPGVVQHTVVSVAAEVKRLSALGVPGVILFGVPRPEDKDDRGTDAARPDGITQRALAAVRDAVGDTVVVMADCCLDEFTDHGHCGVVDPATGTVDNDATPPALRRAGPGPGGRRGRRHRPQRHDGRAGGGRPGRAGTGRLRRHGHPGLRGQVRLRALRTVPRRGRGGHRRRRGPEGVPAGPRATGGRHWPRWRWTSPRGPTW